MAKVSTQRRVRCGFVISLALGCAMQAAVAQRVPVHGVPAHAEGLTETLVSVPLPADVNQVGVMTNSQLTGNFLIRSRRHLADERIATLVVDCPTDSGDTCASDYQASAQRQKDVQQLIAEVQQMQPTLQQVWLVGTSMGTISSSFMALYGFDYGKATIPQFLVHHKDDPCSLTSYAGAVRIAETYKLPLVTVTGGSGFTGGVCQAQTQHGFKGREQDVMRFIAETMKTGTVASTEL
jgi:hypothetical protein